MASDAEAAKQRAEAEQAFIDRVRSKRADYECEREFHRFLLDAYTGSGGFAGKVIPPQASFLGAAAEIYAQSPTQFWGADQYDTYLDRFPREDEPKFQRRRDVAHYLNYTAPICNLFASYLAAGITRDGIDPEGELAAWMQDCDGKGTTWDSLRTTTLVPRALQLGWCPIFVDQDKVPDGTEVKTEGDRKALDLVTRALLLYPANLIDWHADETGTLMWAKVLIQGTDRSDPLGEATCYDRVYVLTTDWVSVYRIEKREGDRETIATEIDKQAHGLGVVPVVVMRATPTPDDSVRGISTMAGVAIENRRHFNLLSELDEHLRSTVFAILQIPIPDGKQAPSEVAIGGGNALPVSASSSQPYKFISPDKSVADTYEKRLGETVREIYRIASAPFDKDGGAAQSGESRAYQFETTNKALVAIAKSFADCDQQTLRLVAKWQGASDAEIEKIRCSPPADFRVDDLAVDLENTVKAIALPGMPTTGKSMLIARTLDKLLPNMNAEQRAKIEGELDAAVKAAEKAEADAAKAAAKAPTKGNAEGGDDADGAEPKPETDKQ